MIKIYSFNEFRPSACIFQFSHNFLKGVSAMLGIME
jgi:hypothetical protein